MSIPRFMTLAQADQILDRGDDSSPSGCGWSKKPRPDRVKTARKFWTKINIPSFDRFLDYLKWCLTLSWWRYLSYRNQSIDFYWFLFEREKAFLKKLCLRYDFYILPRICQVFLNFQVRNFSQNFPFQIWFCISKITSIL